jgi:hypothetical protein
MSPFGGSRITIQSSLMRAYTQEGGSVFFAHCNYCRIHVLGKMTPAMSHSLTTKAWSVRQMLETYQFQWGTHT